MLNILELQANDVEQNGEVKTSRTSTSLCWGDASTQSYFLC